jgi:hypothetical protein
LSFTIATRLSKAASSLLTPRGSWLFALPVTVGCKELADTAFICSGHQG